MFMSKPFSCRCSTFLFAIRFGPNFGRSRPPNFQRGRVGRPALTRRNFCGFCLTPTCASILGKYSKNVAGFAWQSGDPLPARITGLRMVMQQALGSERCCETVEKPYSAGDQKHQEHEYDGVDLHALT